MKSVPAQLRILPSALYAIDDQAFYYASKADGDLSQRWEDAVDQAMNELLLLPESGLHWASTTHYYPDSVAHQSPGLTVAASFTSTFPEYIG